MTGLTIGTGTWYKVAQRAAATAEAIKATGCTIAHFAGTKTVERLHELFDALGS